MAKAKAQVIDHLPKPEGTRYRFGKLTYLTERARAEYLAWKFWSKVCPRVGEDACWEWFGTIQPNGTGLIQVMARYAPDGYAGEGDRLISVAAHRYSYTMRFGEIPKGMDVVQTCGDRACVNPDHMKVARRLGRPGGAPMSAVLGIEPPAKKAKLGSGVWAAST